MYETKFNGLGKIYAKFRPTYPQAFIDYLCTEIGIKKDIAIADIGSGTGIFTNQLLKTGSTVFAVEPNNDMRAVAESDLNSYKNFISVNGNDENTTLDTNSVDLITVAHAFHLFNREKFKIECNRILKPNGKVILIWNSRVFALEAIESGYEINRKYCPQFTGFDDSMRNTRGEEKENDFDDFFVGGYETKTFQNNRTFDLDGFIGCTMSATYAPKENDENYRDYIYELTKCFNEHAIEGKMMMSNNTRSYSGMVSFA